MKVMGCSIWRAASALPVACTVMLLAQPQTARALTQVTAAVDDGDRVALDGNVHPLARPAFDRGAAPESLPARRMMLVLKRSPQQEAALARLLAQQKNPASPNYHHWLTPRDFGNQFGPSLEDLGKVRGWLESQGFRVDRISQGRQVIEFSGTVGQVETAFQTPIHSYVVNGKQHWANSRSPQIPRALSPVVAGVVSLHNFEKKANSRVAGVFRKDAATGEVQAVSKPAFTFINPDLGKLWAVTPADFATIYNVTPAWDAGIDGTGQTIAIVQRTNINPSDVTAFRALFGLPANPPTITLNGPDPGLTSDETEALLDVQWSGAVAKAATINLVVSASTSMADGVDLSALYVVDNNVAPIMSTSFGLCELFLGNAGNAFYSGLWQQAAAQGITSFVSAGDSGSAGCDDPSNTAAVYGLQVNGLASTPYNVAVGGTDFLGNFFAPELYWSDTNDPAQGSALSYIPEMTWNDSCASPVFGADPRADCNNPANLPFMNVTGGGGGKSNCIVSRGSFLPESCLGGYPKPFWQSGVGVLADRRRDIPDVSLFAGNGFLGSFYIVCQADATPDNTCDLATGATQPPNKWDFLGVGGTSVGAPAFAGIMALVNQKTGLIQGNANYDFYRLAASQSYTQCNSTRGSGSACIFNDITAGRNLMPCAHPSMNCLGTGILGAGQLPAYAASGGYDRTTGLGSVNVANLVNGWPVSTAAFAAPTYTVSETGSFVTITVNRVGSAVAPLYASWIVTGGSGSAGVDFPDATGNFTLAAGATTGSFHFPVKHDTAVGDHTAELALYPATAGSPPSTATVTITNVDKPGTIQFLSATTSAPTKPLLATTVNLVVTRTGGTASGVTVAFAATDDTAVSPADYSVVTPSPLTFGAGQTIQHIAISVKRQSHPSNPKFTVTLSSPGSGALLGAKATNTVTIREF